MKTTREIALEVAKPQDHRPLGPATTEDQAIYDGIAANYAKPQEPVAEVELEEPDEPITWRRAKLNSLGLKLPHGTKLYAAPQPCQDCLRHRKNEDLQMHRAIAAETKCAELEAEVDQLKNPRNTDFGKSAAKLADDYMNLLAEFSQQAERRQSAFRRCRDALKADLLATTLDREMRRITEKRNAELIAERDALAITVQKMREALKENHTWHQNYDEYDGYAESELCETNTKALALPDNAAEIIKRHDAEVLRKAADICSERFSLSAAEEAIRSMAAELEVK